MPRLAESTVSAVKANPDVVSIVQDYVKLRKRGRNWIGLCPFHSEKSPSFTVSPDKQLWHCFGCHESGDSIGFVMKIDHLSFTEAVEHIAIRSGIPVEWEERSPDDTARDRELALIRERLAMAREFYRSHFATSPAKAYASRRHLADDFTGFFGLGFSPGPEAVIQHLRSKGATDDEILHLGIAVQSQGRLIDRFADRLVFPILDDRSRTIGFGGRVFTESAHGPKYINSDETAVFVKRRVLYGLDLAKTAIRKRGVAVVMEGYMDVIMAHQCGVTHSVAALGTAFSLDHARVLSRLTSTVITALDQDAAGISATQRVYEQCVTVGISVKVAQFLGKDPADTLVENGADYFEEQLAAAVSFTEFYFKQMVTQYPPDRIDHISKIVEAMVPLLRNETDVVVQRHYVRRIATALSIEPELIVSKLSGTAYSPSSRRVYAPSPPKKTKLQLAEDHLVYVMATHLGDRAHILETISLNDFRTPENQELVRLMRQRPLVDRELLEAIPDDAVRKWLGRLLVERSSDAPGSLHECIQIIQRVPKDERVAQIKARLRELGSGGDDHEVEALLLELQGLIQSLD